MGLLCIWWLERSCQQDVSDSAYGAREMTRNQGIEVSSDVSSETRCSKREATSPRMQE